jgi:hypothetical protein
MFLRVQNQYEPNAESLLFAEAKPDFAGDFLKSAAKVRTFFQLTKHFRTFFAFYLILHIFTRFFLRNSNKYLNFAHCNCRVQF